MAKTRPKKNTRSMSNTRPTTNPNPNPNPNPRRKDTHDKDKGWYNKTECKARTLRLQT